ncbi:hypothetical protein [Streptomyces sp. 900116325]
MTDQPENPAAELRAAAMLLRDDAHRAMTLPHIALMRPELGLALADWLDAAAKSCDAAVIGAASVWRREHEAAERDAWVAQQTDQRALAVARQILGTETTDRACVCAEPETRNTVHRTDGPCYVVSSQLRIVATAIARTEWPKWATGERLDEQPLWQTYLAYADAVLAVLPAPADRAAALREEAARIRAHCPDHLDSNSASGTWVVCHCAVADDIERRMADEAQQPAPAVTEEPTR